MNHARSPASGRHRKTTVSRLRSILLVLAVAFAGLAIVSVGQADAAGTFNDDDGSIHESYIEAIAASGITKGCNPPSNNRFCPDDPVTRGQMAAFLNRALDLADSGADRFTDDDSSLFEADIQAIAAAGITKGCNPPANDRFCPDDLVTRGQMAAFLVRAFGYVDNGGGNRFVDDDSSVFEDDIDRLGTAGVTKGCNPPSNNRFCPDNLVTRAQMASFLGRALNLSPITPDPGFGAGWNYVGVQDPSADNATLTANFGYEAWGYDPATIPVPGTNTHYIDNTAANCSDSGNGTVAVPRCTIPGDLPAGSVVQIEGGPYPGPVTITASGTTSQPVFIHGGGTISGVASGDHAFEIRGSTHLIIDGLNFDGSTIVTGFAGNGAFSISGGSERITVRNSLIHDYPDPYERTNQPGRSSFFANTFITDAQYVAIVNNSFTDIGTYPPAYETGKHLIAGGSDTAWVWIVGNEFVRGSEDAIQIRANSDADPNFFWTIAGNLFESMGENAVDVKTGSEVIIASNVACDFRPVTFANGSGSGGVAFTFNNDNGGPRESWLINNVTTTCSGSGGTDGTVNIGFMMQSESGTNYVVGNLFDQTVSRGMWIGSSSVPVIEMNTFYAPGDDGILISYSGSPGGSIVGNIVVDPPAGQDAINLNQTYMQGWARDNVLFDPDGPVGEKNVPAGANLLDIDPKLVDPDNDDFTLAAGSPARGAVNPAPVSWGVFQSRYGFSIAFDIDGNPRTDPISAGAFQ